MKKDIKEEGGQVASGLKAVDTVAEQVMWTVVGVFVVCATGMMV